jgi:hypothetical protein
MAKIRFLWRVIVGHEFGNEGDAAVADVAAVGQSHHRIDFVLRTVAVAADLEAFFGHRFSFKWVIEFIRFK